MWYHLFTIAVKLKQDLNHIAEQKKHISKIEKENLRLSDKYETTLSLIGNVPEFHKNPIPAIQVLSEIGSNKYVFPTVLLVS